MHEFINWLRSMFSGWKPWVVVPPWDVGVRVRLGRVAAKLSPGPHFRLPLLDEVVLVNTRLRVCGVPSVTVRGDNGKIRSSQASVAYRVVDPLSAMMAFTNCDNAIRMLVQAELSRTRDPDEIRGAVTRAIDGKGIAIEFVRLVEDVEVRTYRIMNDSFRLYGDELGTPIGPPGSVPMLARW